MPSRLLIVVNSLAFFMSHRLPIASSARAAGYDVHVAAPNDSLSIEIMRLGFHYHELPFSRVGVNPISELLFIFRFARLIRSVCPDVLHLVTIKPVIYGGILARCLQVSSVVAAVSGLGNMFSSRRVRDRILRPLVRSLYRFSLGHRNLRVIVQNPSDQLVLQQLSALPADSFLLLPGSGTDLARFSAGPEPESGEPIVVMAGRMLRDKGVVEFVEAAQLLRGTGTQARFLLVGGTDIGNPTAVSEESLKHWVKTGVVEWMGYRADIEEVFARCNLVVFPSYYGEGMPKVLLDAAASGRAVITTDWPGCRDAIDPGVTGLLVPVRDAHALAEGIRYLLENQLVRRQMGLAARLHAERFFSADAVAEAHLEVYRKLLTG